MWELAISPQAFKSLFINGHETQPASRSQNKRASSGLRHQGTHTLAISPFDENDFCRDATSRAGSSGSALSWPWHSLCATVEFWCQAQSGAHVEGVLQTGGGLFSCSHPAALHHPVDTVISWEALCICRAVVVVPLRCCRCSTLTRPLKLLYVFGFIYTHSCQPVRSLPWAACVPADAHTNSLICGCGAPAMVNRALCDNFINSLILGWWKETQRAMTFN